MASLYSNENFAIDIVQLLRDYGHDVLTSYQAGQANQGIPDRDVLLFATNQKRTLITFNRGASQLCKKHKSLRRIGDI